MSVVTKIMQPQLSDQLLWIYCRSGSTTAVRLSVAEFLVPQWFKIGIILNVRSICHRPMLPSASYSLTHGSVTNLFVAGIKSLML